MPGATSCRSVELVVVVFSGQSAEVAESHGLAAHGLDTVRVVSDDASLPGHAGSVSGLAPACAGRRSSARLRLVDRVYFVIKGLSASRDAHMMPTLASRLDHSTAAVPEARSDQHRALDGSE